ncbi:MAG TPA: transcriptional repressor [Candidatus Dormibacteraeota bacterium]|jgi:Fe2+ or Zn2+ uptake regulation protein
MSQNRSADTPAVLSLRAAGLRATPQRLAVLGALEDAGGAHLSADEVWQRTAPKPRMDRSTVYRILADLTAAGLLKQVRLRDGVSRFEIQSVEHHHAVCTECGATMDIDATLVGSWAGQLRSAAGFVIGRDALLLTGLCRACAASAGMGPRPRAEDSKG